MEKEKDIVGVFKSSIKDGIEQAKKGQFPKEALLSSMTTIENHSAIIFRPNNYRRKIEVKPKDNSTIEKIRVLLGAIPNAHTKIISIKQYNPNITIQYGQCYLTAIYHQNIIAGNKETFAIERDTPEEVNKRIDEIRERIRQKIDNALESFIKQFDIRLPLKKPIWDRYEDFVKGFDFIDKIPKEVIIHDTIFKKVYGDGIEFKSSEKEKTPIASKYKINCE